MSHDRDLVQRYMGVEETGFRLVATKRRKSLTVGQVEDYGKYDNIVGIVTYGSVADRWMLNSKAVKIRALNRVRPVGGTGIDQLSEGSSLRVDA